MKVCEQPECEAQAMFRIGLKDPWTWPKNLCFVHTLRFISDERERQNAETLKHDFMAGATQK